MSGKFKYPFVAINKETDEYRFLGVFFTLKDAKMYSVVQPGEIVASKIPVNPELEWANRMISRWQTEVVDAVEHDFALIVKSWLPDQPNHAQTVLTKRALKLDRDAVYEVVTEINGIPDDEITVSRWAMLYDRLDKMFPREAKPIEGWV